MNVEFTRRDFFSVLGSGILVLCTVDEIDAQESGRRSGGDARPQEISAWLHIGEDGSVTVYTGKVEVGQNIRTSLAQAVAEELRTPLTSIRLVMGDTDLTPFDAGTFGSRTTPTMAPQLRKAAAAARDSLVELAARKWNVDRKAVTISDGKVASDGHSASFGELTRGEKLMQRIAADVALTPASEWKVAGRSVPKVDGRDFVNGQHRFTTDIRRPGMLYGKVLRPAAFGATLVSLDDSAARGLPGVTVARERDFVAVAAPDQETAERASAALKAEWKTQPAPSDRELFAYLKANADPDERANTRGSLEKGMAEAERKLSQTYTVSYIAHVPLEPRAAVAEWNGDKLTVWTGSQRPFGVRGELASAFGIPQDRVRVIIPDTGSGYGGSTPGTRRSRPHGSRKPRANPFKSSGHEKKSSRGRTSGRRA